MRLKFRKAFTLIELIAVIAVMGTLVGVSTTSYNGYRDMAEREESKLAVQQVKNAVDNYYSANEYYPTLPDERNQPTPDTTTNDSSGNPVIHKGYSEINIEELINQRFLQEKPHLKEGQFFAVHYNGLVTVEETQTSRLTIEDGQIIIPKKTNNTLNYTVYTDTSKKVSSVTVKETNSDGSDLAKGNSSTASKGTGGIYTGTIKLSNSAPGAKYFRATIKYTDGTSVSDAAIEYAMSSDEVTEAPYWITDVSKDRAFNVARHPAIANHSKTGTSITLDWTNNQIESYTYMISAYEITKTFTNNDGKTESEKITIPVGGSNKSSTTYTDTAVQGGKSYTYTIVAYSNGLKTANTITLTVSAPKYTDTLPYFYNVTKNNYQSSYADTIMFNLGDKEGITLGKNQYGNDGAAKVIVHVGQVKNGALVLNEQNSYYTSYELTSSNIVSTEKKTIKDSSGKNVTIDVHTFALSVEVSDDYIVYWIEVIDNNTYRTYFSYNPNIKKTDTETEEQAEDRRTVISKTHPDDQFKTLTKEQKEQSMKNNKWSIMRGFVKIHEDSFVDTSKIDTANSAFKIYNGKIYLP